MNNQNYSVTVSFELAGGAVSLLRTNKKEINLPGTKVNPFGSFSHYSGLQRDLEFKSDSPRIEKIFTQDHINAHPSNYELRLLDRDYKIAKIKWNKLDINQKLLAHCRDWQNDLQAISFTFI